MRCLVPVPASVLFFNNFVGQITEGGEYECKIDEHKKKKKKKSKEKKSEETDKNGTQINKNCPANNNSNKDLIEKKKEIEKTQKLHN